MARFEFRLPDIGEGIAEAEVVSWLVQPGDIVSEDQPIAEMMTDKATVEMESPVSGTVVSLAGDVGDMVAIGATLILFEVDGDDAPSEAPADAQMQADPVSLSPATLGAELVCDADTAPAEPALTAVADAAPDQPHGKRTSASPAVRARARELAIDLSLVRPGEGGRVRHADLDAYLTYNRHSGYARTAAPRNDEAIKVAGLRRRIAENMTASKRHIPHFSYVEEIEVTKLEQLRADLNANRGERPRLTVLPFIIVAVCKAVPAFPMMNARYDDAAGVVTRCGAVHMGIATQTEAGLMVPVIRDAHARNIWQLSAETERLAQAARSGKAKPDELSGSTLTITSLGPLGGLATTPVINRPEVAIIGPNRIFDRPVFDGDKIRRAKIMNVSISCDHRVVDGWDAAKFVQDVKRLLETPALLFAD